MKITIYQNREVYKEESKIGNDSENKVETLEFEFPEEYEDFTKYIEFQIKGGKYVDLIDNNKYVITREVAKYGKIKTQIVLKKNTENDVMVFKSDIFTLNVSNSINATENLVNTVGVDLIEKIVTKNNEQDTRLDILEADNATNKENISSIQDRQVTQDNRIDDLEADNTSNKSRITDIETKNVEQDNKIVSLESKNTEQDTNIQKNTADIKTINEKNKSQDTEITNIKSEQATQNTNIQTNTKSIEEINKKDKSQDNLIEELQTENTKLKKTIESMQIPGEATGNPIHLSDSSDIECEIVPIGGAEQNVEPTPDAPIEVVTVGSNVNLLENKAITQTINGVTFTVNKDGSIMVNGTATTNITFKINNDIVPKNISNLILSGCPNNGSKDTYDLKIELYKNGVWMKVLYDFGNGVNTEDLSEYTSCTISTTIRKDYNANNLIFKPKLEKGTVVTPYSPYGQGSVEISVDNGLETTDTNYQSYTKVLPLQKEFVKIGDVEDTFVKVDGKWYEKHNIKKLTLDGTESWNWHSDGFGFTKAAGISIVPNDKVLAISNFLLGIQIGSNGTYYKDKDNVIFSWMSGNLICLKATNKFTDVETLKSWLAEQYANGTPVTVYYVLTTSELLECTEEQEEILNSFYTYKGVTNVSMSGIGTLKVNYKKDLETLFNNINSALLS